MESINPNRVEEIFKDCLYKDGEIKNGVPADAIIVKGVAHSFGFHPERLQSHRGEIGQMLLLMDDSFLLTKGGGMSFLNACKDRNGVLWTGLHLRMEQLFTMGEGLGIASKPLPDYLVAMMPGGMPYYIVDDTKIGEGAVSQG